MEQTGEERRALRRYISKYVIHYKKTKQVDLKSSCHQISEEHWRSAAVYHSTDTISSNEIPKVKQARPGQLMKRLLNFGAKLLIDL